MGTLLNPQTWVGWTAALLVTALVVAAAAVNGSNRMLNTILWVTGGVVAAVSAFNALARK